MSDLISFHDETVCLKSVEIHENEGDYAGEYNSNQILIDTDKYLISIDFCYNRDPAMKVVEK